MRNAPLLCNLKVHYHVHKFLALYPVLNQLNPVHTLTSYFSLIFILYFPPTYASVSQEVSSLDILQVKFCISFSSFLCVHAPHTIILSHPKILLSSGTKNSILIDPFFKG